MIKGHRILEFPTEQTSDSISSAEYALIEHGVFILEIFEKTV